MSYDKVK